MNNIIALIPAAGRGSRMMSLTEDMPKAMLPLHNKPIIAWHIEKLIEEGIKDVCIIVGYKKEKLIDFVDKFYSDRINIIYAEQKSLKGLAHAIGEGINEIKSKIKEDKKILIILGDTIIKDPLDEYFNDNNWIGYKEVNDYKRWCLINSENGIVKNFVDKPDYDPLTRKAVIGIYYFNSMNKLKTSIDEIIKKDIKIKNEYQLSSAMELYDGEINCIEFKEWYDCGEVETFNNTRKNITRYFNSIEVTDDNTIIKRSTNEKKIKQEINWFLNIPNKLRVFVPQLIDYSLKTNETFYELEYINFTPMQELFMYNLPDLPEWDKFFNIVFNIINKFNKHSGKSRFNSAVHLNEILINKTFDRLEELKKDMYWEYLLSQKSININGITYNNLNYYIDLIKEYANKNILPESDQYWQIIHGDLFFGNMMYDVNSSTLKLLDPRGNFDIDGIYGDIRYDLAKLNHSVHGKYDFIVNGLYSLEVANNDFNYILYDTPRHVKIDELFKKHLLQNGYNYEHIQFITALLFTSMIPLHKENNNNQIMMYLTAIQLFNSIFEH